MRALTTAPLSLAMMSWGVPLGAHRPGHQILICGDAAAIEHKLELGPGDVLEMDTADVCRAAGADARSECSVWIRLQPRDQFHSILRRESNFSDQPQPRNGDQ